MEDQNQNAGDGVQSQTFTIGGQEYNQSDLEDLVGRGKWAREVEEKFNTKLDRVVPEYTRLTQERKAWQAKEAEYRSQLDEFNKKQQAGVETSADLTQAKEAARKLGIPFQDEIEKNYVKRDEIPSLVQQYIAQQREVDTVLSQADKLSQELNGQDGRPRFNKLAVLSYADATGETDLKKAYETMYADELKAWGESQAAKAKRPGLQTFAGSRGNKLPPQVKPTKDNLGQLLAETME